MGSVGFIPTYTGIQSISDVLSFMVNSTTVQPKPKLIFSQGVYLEYIYSWGEVGASVRQRCRTFWAFLFREGGLGEGGLGQEDRMEG